MGLTLPPATGMRLRERGIEKVRVTRNQNWFNEKELAKRLNVQVSWIYRRTRLGQEAIPHVKMGKYVRFDWEEVVAFYREDLQ